MTEMPKSRAHSYWRIVWRQFKKERMSLVSVVLLSLLGIVAISAPFLAESRPIVMRYEGQWLWFPNLGIRYEALQDVDFRYWEPGPEDYALYPLVPYSFDQSNLLERLAEPGPDHWLGTDDRGRDVLSRLIWGTRVSMSVGFVAMGIAVFIGVVLGTVAGYYRGWVDGVVMRLIEIVVCFPTLVLVVVLVAFLPPSIWNIMAVLGLFSWPNVARLVRGQFFRLTEIDFTIAARATGLSDLRIIFRHLLPNALAPVLVAATFGVAGAILLESALSFLGFGVPPPTASWGELLNQSRSYFQRGAWWLVVFPGVAIFLTVTAFNLVGDGLREAMDPRMRDR